MSRLPLQTLAGAPPASKPFIEKSLRNNGFLPNLVASLATAPTVLETYLTVAEINSRSGLTLAEREAIQITSAATHGCGFCVAGHTSVALKKAAVAPAAVEALREGKEVPDRRLNAIAAFTRAMIASRGAVTDEELNAFRGAGFTDANALEVVLGVSLATLCNFANNLVQNELNSELASYRWEPQARAL